MSSDVLPAVLTYAPLPRARNRWLLVLVAGVTTSVLSLAAAVWIDHYTKGDFYILGLYANGILPIGALIVGFAAASGYAAAAWLLGIRIRASLLAGIACLTFAAYAAMHGLEYLSRGPRLARAIGRPIGFFEYFDATTRAMRFTSTRHGSASDHDEPLGTLGYGVRLLEVAGFMLGTLCLPFLLRGKRYCDLCERYHDTIELGVLPASVMPKKTFGVFKPSKVIFDGEHVAAGERAGELVGRLSELITAGDGAAARQMIDDFKPDSKAASKLPRRIQLTLSRCARCGTSLFLPTLVVGIDPRNTSRTPMAEINVPIEVADTLRPRKRTATSAIVS